MTSSISSSTTSLWILDNLLINSLDKIPDTYVKSAGGVVNLGGSDASFNLGCSGASLDSLGTNLRALRHIDVNDKFDIGTLRMHGVLNDNAGIISESEKVNRCQSTIIWLPDRLRQIISCLSQDEDYSLKHGML